MIYSTQITPPYEVADKTLQVQTGEVGQNAATAASPLLGLAVVALAAYLIFGS